MGCKQRNYVGHRWGWGWVLPKNHPGVRYFYSSGASQCAYIQKVTMAACRLDGFGERGEAFEISLEILLPYLSPFLTFLALKLILVFHISSGIEWGNLSCDDLPGNISYAADWGQVETVCYCLYQANAGRHQLQNCLKLRQLMSKWKGNWHQWLRQEPES